MLFYKTLGDESENTIYILFQSASDRYFLMADLPSGRRGMHRHIPPLLVFIVRKISHPTQQTAAVVFPGEHNKGFMVSLC